MTITIDTASFDEGGRFVHAEDAVAQLCLALVRLEAELADRGLDLAAVVRMRVLAADPDEAAELVDLARERFRPFGAAPDIRSVHVGLMRLHELTGVVVDPESRTARVLGGTLRQDVVAAAAPHGLTALHGSAGDVAVTGYVLGGGLSFYGRKHGLASTHLRAVELVTADGSLVRASADEHPELFWALRGGTGGNFGVVVALEIELLAVADVVAGMLLWDLEHAPEVVSAWAQWTADLPESVTTSLRLMRFPPLPDECTASPDGAMGYHFVNPALIAPGAPVDPTQPQVLTYGPSASGELELWSAEFFEPNIGQPTPMLGSRPFDGPMPGHEPGMPEHYDLHVWIGQHNPAGLYAPFNPSLSC